MFGKRSTSAGAAPVPVVIPQGARQAIAPAASVRAAPVLVVGENRRSESYYTLFTPKSGIPSDQ